jgi:hypothetical protein
MPGWLFFFGRGGIFFTISSVEIFFAVGNCTVCLVVDAAEQFPGQPPRPHFAMVRPSPDLEGWNGWGPCSYVKWITHQWRSFSFWHSTSGIVWCRKKTWRMVEMMVKIGCEVN